ncbi:MAG: ABC transporter ATP-binding protein [Planctomycetota bacterium]
MAFALCWQLALLSLGTLVVLVYPLYRLGRHVRKQATKRQDFHARLTQSRVQMLSGFKTIKMFAREAFESDRFEDQCSTFFRKAMRVCRSKTFGVSGTTLFTGLLAALGMLLGMLAIRAGLWGLTAGTLVAFVFASQQAFMAFKRLTKNYNKLNESLAGSDRIFRYLDATPDPPERTGRSMEGIEPAIAVENVTFAYGDELVLADVSFEAKPGEVVAIVGGSGGGKTTLLDLVARLYRPQSGRITVGGIDIHEFDIDSYLGQIAVVPQEPFLFATTIRDNIAYGKPDATDAEIIRAATIANIHDFISSLPDGYDTMLGERGETVSGGQRQRIATARAVIRNANILLLDEATSALDAESEQAFYDALENLIAEGDRTVLVVAHRLSTVTNADRILVLENGRIVEGGTHAELIKSGRTYRRLFETQFQQPANP